MHKVKKHKKHLTEEEVAIYVDALQQGKLKNVSRRIRQHIIKCDECTREVLHLLEILSLDAISNNDTIKM